MEVWSFLNTSHEEVVAIANVVIAIGTIVLAFGIPYAINAAKNEERDTFYATLDRAYFDIQKLLIDHPHLAQTDCRQKTPDQVTQYNAFAFIVWNYLETIYDYTNGEKTKEQKRLAETWAGVMSHEARTHAAWFLNPENRPKFKDAFVNHVEEKQLLRETPRRT